MSLPIITHVNAYNPLSAEEEITIMKDLAVAIENNHTTKIQRIHNRLIEAFSPIVDKLAHKFASSKVDHEDMVSVGLIGLTQSIQRFNPELGFKMATFIYRTVTCVLLDHIAYINNDTKILGKASNKSLFFKLSKELSNVFLTQSGNIPYQVIADIAERYNTTTSDVQSMITMLHNGNLSTNMVMEDGSEFGSSYISDGSNSENTLVENDVESFQQELIKDALSALDARSKDIITRRVLVDEDEIATLESLATEYGVTRERIRQIQMIATEKLKNIITIKVRKQGISKKDIFTEQQDKTVSVFS